MSALLLALVMAAAETDREVLLWVEEQGGRVERDRDGRLAAVDLTSTWITDADLGRLAGLDRLRRLTLARTRITDLGLQRLKPLAEVVEMDCYYCEQLTEDGVAHLKGWTKLERLNLRGTKVTSRVFEHLARLTSLRWLDLAHTQIEDEGFEHLAPLARLEHLAIGGNRLEGGALASLKLLPALRSLDAGGIQRVDSGLWGLALTDQNLERLGALAGLTELNLSGANLADRGLDRPGHPEAERSELRDLSKLRGLVNLEKLDLSRTPLSREALESLGAPARLRELRLGYASKIGDSALDILAGFPGLRIVHLEGTPLTPEALAELRRRRVGLAVQWP